MSKCNFEFLLNTIIPKIKRTDEKSNTYYHKFGDDYGFLATEDSYKSVFSEFQLLPFLL